MNKFVLELRDFLSLIAGLTSATFICLIPLSLLLMLGVNRDFIFRTLNNPLEMWLTFYIIYLIPFSVAQIALVSQDTDLVTELEKELGWYKEVRQ